MGLKSWKKVKKSHGWGWLIGVCNQCGDTLPLEKIEESSGKKLFLCFHCKEDRRRVPQVKKGDTEESQQQKDWDNLTSIGGQN